MSDVFNGILANATAFRWLFLLALLWGFYRYINTEGNPLEWWHFISSKGSDGGYYADLNKLGQVTGIVFGSLAIMQVSANAKSDFAGFALVLGAYFAFVGGVAGYSAYLRSKNARTETIVTTEPVPVSSPQKITKTVTEPANPDAGIRQGEVG